jgi:predicted transcriptional regulator
MIMDDETLKVFAYVNISSYRVRSVKALKGGVKTPTDIAKDAGIKLNHISKVLRQLKDCGVAVCLNEEAHRGRKYRLTSVGEEIVDHLDNMG